MAELRVLVARYMNEDAARRAVVDDSRRHPFNARNLRAIDDYAALEDSVRGWYSERMADNFLQELTGGNASHNRVHFTYYPSLRNSLFVSVRRDGTDIRTAVLRWCR
ncbi:MAG: hypothetical protein HN849_20360 [Victivallales bacterium]|nr:hypothetical protein [Victivallales bacterium]